MLNETFANAVLGAMFGQGDLHKKATEVRFTSSGSNSTSVTATATEKPGELVTGGLGTVCYIGLLTDWNDKGTLETVQEYTDADYCRVLLGKTTVVYNKSGNSISGNLVTDETLPMGTPAGGEISNKDFIKFNPLADGASDVTFKGFALYTAATNGTAMYAAALKEPLTGVSAGDVPVFHKGELSVTFGKDGEAVAAAALSAEG